MAFRAFTQNSGTSATPSTTVPTGVQSGDIVLLCASTDDGSAVFQTADWPTGFAALSSVTMTFDGQVAAVGWKLLSGADSGSYTFGNLGVSSDWLCQAYAFSGRDSTNPPTISTTATGNATSSPASVAANGVTAVSGDDLAWFCVPDVNVNGSGNGTTQPTGYTKATDQEGTFTNLSMAYLENVAAGATGTVTGQFAFTAATDWAAWLVRIPVATGGGGGGTIVSPLSSFGPSYAATKASVM